MATLRGKYSVRRLRFLKAVISRGALRRTTGLVLAKPCIVLAAKFLGPGPARLRLVKLAHEMDGGAILAVRPARRLKAEEHVRPVQRAA